MWLSSSTAHTTSLTGISALRRAVGGGANNRLFRATGSDGDWAIKFTKRDERDRAGREGSYRTEVMLR